MITYFRIFPHSMRWIVFSLTLDMSTYPYLIVLNTVFFLFYSLCYHCNGLNVMVSIVLLLFSFFKGWGFLVFWFSVFVSCTVSNFTQSIENLKKHDIFRSFFSTKNPRHIIQHTHNISFV